MASTEKLIIELDAKVNNLTSELDKVNSKLDETERNTDGADKSLASFASTAKVAAGAAAAAVTAFTAFVSITAKSRQELQNLSATANESIANFEASAFALKNFGLEASDTAQLFNDIGEAASEFANVQAGPFQDLADQLGLTKNEAISLAAEVKELSGTDAMVRLINVVNEADLSITDANQALKAISSDFQFLTPLIQDNAKSLETLAQRYNDANSALSLTAQQERDLAALAQTNSLLFEQLGNSAALISATVAPAFDSFFNAVIDIVPEATNTLVDFFNKFQEASSISSISSIDREIEELTKTASNYEEQLNSLLAGEYQTLFGNEQQIQAQADGLSEVNQRLADLKARRDELIAQQSVIDEVQGRSGGSFSTSLSGISDQDGDLSAIEDRFKSEEQLLREKLERELEIVGENQLLRLELESEFQNALLDLELNRVDKEIEARNKKEEIAKKQRADDLKQEQQLQKEKTSAALSYADAAINIGNLLFEDNKALRAGLVVADTAAGIVRAFADLPYPAALAASASIAATGVAQLSAINSASKGGGSVASEASSAAPVSADIPQETPELSVSASDASGANVSVIKLEFDDNTDLGAFLKQAIKTSEVNGTA